MTVLRRLTPRRLVLVAGLSLAATVAFGWAMWVLDRQLAPNGILSLELAFTAENAKAILDAWGTAGRAAAFHSLRLDTLFILLGYPPLLAALCLLVAPRPAAGAKASPGEWLAFAALVAGALDLVEDACLWIVIAHPQDPSSGLTWLAGIAASLKWLLALAALGYAAVGLTRLLGTVTPLVRWFLGFPVLILEAALVLAILWRQALASLGIPDLFWVEGRFTPFLAGVGTGVLLVHLGVVGFLVDGRRAELRGRRYFGEWASGVAVAWFVAWLPSTREESLLLGSYLLRTSVPLLALAVASAPGAPGGVSPWWLPVGAVLSAAVNAILVVWIAPQPVPWFLTVEPVRRRVTGALFPNLHLLAHWFVVLQVGVYVVMWILYHVLGWGVSVALAVSVLLGVIASVYGFLKFFHPASTFGILAAAIVVYVSLNAPGGHHLPRLDYHRRVKLNRSEAVVSRATAPDPHLQAWRTARGALSPLVVVAVDGGGIRAAVWTNVVLSQLERDVPDFPYFVRLVTGASGGMVGVASYVGSLQPPDAPNRHRDLKGSVLRPGELVDRVASDGLGPVARELVFTDLLLPPFLHSTADRGLALERAWEKSTGILGQAFADLAPGEAAGWRPSLLVSPLIVEDGRRLLISNIDVHDLTTVPVIPPSLQALEYFGHIEPRPGKLHLSTAVRMNASFPYVSPAAELPTDPARHTLDAGYYDEHGVELAGTWIWTHRAWLMDNTRGVLLVQVPDARARATKEKASEDRRDWWGAGLIGVTAPIEALRSSQGASMDYRNDQLVRFLDDTLNAGRPGFFATVAFEPDQTKAEEPLPGCQSWLRETLGMKETAYKDVALSWRLTSCEVSRLKQSIRGGDQDASCRERRRFEAWWNAHKPDAEPRASVQCPAPSS